MRLDLFVTPQEIPHFYTKGRRVVIVDVLRSATTLAYALQSGADKIIPVDSLEAVREIVASLGKENALLIGSQDGEKLEGFDLENSPVAVQNEGISSKTVVFSSDDGGRLFSGGTEAVEKLALSLCNMSAVRDYLREKDDAELTLICAGHQGRFALDDAVAAGMLIDQLGASENDGNLNDAARAAWILYLSYRENLSEALQISAQGRFLAEKGRDGDIELAAVLDGAPIVPVSRDGRITVA